MKSPCSYFPVYKCYKNDISMEKIPFHARYLLFFTMPFPNPLARYQFSKYTRAQSLWG